MFDSIQAFNVTNAYPLIPADGGTEEGTIADFEPIFAAITREYGLHFDMKVAQSTGARVIINDRWGR